MRRDFALSFRSLLRYLPPPVKTLLPLLFLLSAATGCTTGPGSSGGLGTGSPGGGDPDAGGDGDGAPHGAEDTAIDGAEDGAGPAGDAGPADAGDASDSAADAAGEDAPGGPDDGAETSTGEDAAPEPETPPAPEPEPEPVPEPDVTAPFSHCSAPGGARNVYDLQDPQCPDHPKPEPKGAPGLPVTLAGVVVTARFGDTMFVQEATSGPYSGIAVYTAGKWTGALEPGDVVDVTGEYYEFYDASQVYLVSFKEVGKAPVPEPFVPSDPAKLATGGSLAELFEGVLCRVEDVETIHTKPDCPHEFGEFLVTGGLRVDDAGFKWDARLGDQFESVTGPLHYTFGNAKLEPRSAADLVVLKKGATGSISKCIKGDCIEPETAPVTRDVVVNEVMADPYGQDESQEWFELHNTTGLPIDLTGWTVKDCATQEMALVGFDLVLPPGGFVVVGAETSPALNGGVPVDLGYPTTFYFPNTLGALLLYDAGGELVDQMRYSTFEPFDSLEVGHSLERIDPGVDGTSPDNWAPGATEFGTNANLGTPGAPNDASK